MVKNKVAFDANPLIGNRTGIGNLTNELILSLAKKNQNIQFIGHYFNFLGLNKDEQLPSSENISYKRSFLVPPKLLSLLRRMNIQVPFELYCRVRVDTILFTNFVSTSSLFKANKIQFIYDLCYVDMPDYVSDRNGNFLRKWVAKTIPSANKVITISNFTKQRIVEEYSISSENVIVIPVPPEKKTKPDTKILEKYSLNKFILSVGTIEPRKNIVTILESYSLLPKSLSDKYPLVLLGGSGWNDTEILERIDELRRKKLNIITTGYVSGADKSALYNNAVLVVQLSHYEGFGMPVLEAMNYGKAVLCSDIPVFREIANGIADFTPELDVDKASKKMENLISSKQQNLKLSKKSDSYISRYPKWSEVANIVNRVL